MARVTVEDCIDKVDTRFELIMLSAQRARDIGSGALLTVPRDNDKNTVVALREIAEETVNSEDLKEALIRTHQRILISEEDEDNPEIDMMDGETEFASLSHQSENTGESEAADEEGSEEPDLSKLAGVSE